MPYAKDEYIKNIFGKEFQALERAKEVLKEGDEDETPLVREFLALCTQYEKLLKQTTKITRLSDVIQKKMLSTQEKIEAQYEALEKANSEIQEKNRALTDAYKKIEEASRTDPLTKIYNRRAILATLQYEIKFFKRYQRPFAILFSDIDNFKNFNDQFGHDCGDFILVTVAGIMKDMLRETDHVGRWGGEEFIIVLPASDLERGRSVAEKIRETIAAGQHTFDNQSHSITMTFGVAVYDGNGDIDACINRADKAMYMGKQRGRNCVMTTDGV